MRSVAAARGMSSGAVARRPAPAGRVALALAAGGTIAVVDGWRLAAISAAAAIAIVATRIRFASYAAVALLVACAVVVAVGGGVSDPFSATS